MNRMLSSVDWSLVQTFIAVAETGSLSAGARALGSSQPTVGRQIRQMEDQLEVSLFRRQAKGLILTQVGTELLPAARAMQDAARAISLAAAGRSERLSGPVRISASVFVAHHALPPILATLRQDEPDISIDLVANDATDNLLYREADIAVRMYRSEQLDIITKHIGEIELGVFASSEYLDRVGRPGTVAEMWEKDLIGYDRSDLILKGMRSFGLEATRDWFATRCDHHGVLWELLKAGCGIGFAQVSVAQNEPTVERLFPELELPTLPLWLAAHEAMRHTPRIRKVWDRLETGLKPLVMVPR